jgi:lysozyme
MPLNVSETAAIYRLLLEHEGVRYFPYVDTVGKITIGVGHNLTDKGIKKQVAQILFEEDLADTLAFLDEKLPWVWTLDSARKLVMVDMAFNMMGRLLTFKNTLKAIEAGEWEKAANGMLASKWARQVGRRAQRLALTMKTGILPT